MALASWLVPVVTLIGACIVSSGNFAVQRWRFRVDRLVVSTDQLCTEINSAAAQAARYWHLDANQPEQAGRCRELESEVVALQSRIQQLIAAIQEQDPRLDLTGAAENVMNLFDAMTGGHFRETGRAADGLRAARALAIAAELNGELRIAVARRSRLLW
jgi:hypothetical protein